MCVCLWIILVIFIYIFLILLIWFDSLNFAIFSQIFWGFSIYKIYIWILIIDSFVYCYFVHLKKLWENFYTFSCIVFKKIKTFIDMSKRFLIPLLRQINLHFHARRIQFNYFELLLQSLIRCAEEKQHISQKIHWLKWKENSKK